MNFFKSMSKLDARNVNSIVLAYIGDAVHSLIVREQLIKNSDFKAGTLHELASKKVNAGSQAHLAEKILPHLTDEELDIYKRGRNSKNQHSAKNQTLEDYKKATAIEAVFGYLYLIGDSDRILELINLN